MESSPPARRNRHPRAARRPTGGPPTSHLAAGRQFHTREGHLNVPRKHVEEMTGEGGEVTAVRLGGWLDNTRRRSDRLPADRRAELDALGMRW
ncbi:helicase associated domain-containing protein [Streptomyces mirabilis]